MKKKIIIIGGEGNGGVAAACIVDMKLRYQIDDIDLIGFLNDVEQIGDEINNYPILGKTKDWAKFAEEEDVFFIFAIHPVGHGSLRVRLFNSLNIPDEKLFTLVHPTAFIAYNAKLDPGVMVMSNSYIGPAAHLGKCVLCMANTVVGHNTSLQPYCHVSVGAVISSYIKIGLASDVALNATVMEKLTIGDFAVVGAGAMITKNINDNEIVVGNPQRVLRLAEDKQRYTL